MRIDQHLELNSSFGVSSQSFLSDEEIISQKPGTFSLVDQTDTRDVKEEVRNTVGPHSSSC